MESPRFRKSLLAVTVGCTLVGMASAPAFAGMITGWNTGNVVTTPDLNAEGDGFSYIYDQPTTDGTGASTSAYIKFTPPETESPGLKVENGAPPSNGTSYEGADVYNCILSAGPSTCNGPFQSGKRFKFDATGFEPVDLVFNIDPAGEFPTTVDNSTNDELYKVFQKYGNATDERIGSFSVELGFGIGENFVASQDNDGLGFRDASLGGTIEPPHNEFSSLFAAGLFGKADGDKHLLDGYFSDKRSGFNLIYAEDKITSAGIFGVYEDLFGKWLPYSGTPQGFLFDHDNDPSTDAILMANQEEDGSWSVNRYIMADGTVDEIDTINPTLHRDLTLAEVISFLNENGSFCTNSVICYEDAIEDLAKFNLTYFLDQVTIDDDVLLTAYDQQPTFTLRVTANEVPTAGVLPMLGLGLLGMLAARRRSGARVQG